MDEGDKQPQDQIGNNSRFSLLVLGIGAAALIIAVIIIMFSNKTDLGNGASGNANASFPIADVIEGRWTFKGNDGEPLSNGQAFIEVVDQDTVRFSQVFTPTGRIGRAANELVLTCQIESKSQVELDEIKELFPGFKIDESIWSKASYVKLRVDEMHCIHFVVNEGKDLAIAKMDYGSWPSAYASYVYQDDKKFEDMLADEMMKVKGFHSVSGKLTVDGKPLRKQMVHVTFYLVGATHKDIVASGFTDKNGQFVMYSGQLGIPGVKTGNYKVVLKTDEVTDYMGELPDDNESKSNASGDDDDEPGLHPGPGDELFPIKLKSRKSTDIEIEITGPTSDLIIDLKTE